jgi:hypothetical protein
MWRKSILVGASIVVPAGVFLALTPGIASANPVATGSASCTSVIGSGTVSPGISLAGSPGGVNITFTAKLDACANSSVTSPAADVITSGLATGSGNFTTTATNGSKCAKFDSIATSVGVIKVKIHWNATTAIANTKIKYTGNPAPITGPTNGFDTITFSAPATATGSFSAGPPDTVKLVTNLPAPGTHCVGTTTNFKITSGSVAVD